MQGGALGGSENRDQVCALSIPEKAFQSTLKLLLVFCCVAPDLITSHFRWYLGGPCEVVQEGTNIEKCYFKLTKKVMKEILSKRK